METGYHKKSYHAQEADFREISYYVDDGSQPKQIKQISATFNLNYIIFSLLSKIQTVKYLM